MRRQAQALLDRMWATPYPIRDQHRSAALDRVIRAQIGRGPLDTRDRSTMTTWEAEANLGHRHDEAMVAQWAARTIDDLIAIEPAVAMENAL